MTIEELKLYLRIDDDVENILIEAQLKAAIQYIEGMTGKTYKADNEVWNICIKLMVAHWYENREIQASSNRGSIIKIEHTVDALVNHIALCGTYE